MWIANFASDAHFAAFVHNDKDNVASTGEYIRTISLVRRQSPRSVHAP